MRALGIDRVDGGYVLALLEVTGRSVETPRTRVVSAQGGAADTLRAAIEELCPSPPDAIATALAEHQVTQRILHLPFSDPSRLAATVPFELESAVPFDLEDAIPAFTVLSRQEGSDVLAAMAPKSEVADHLAELAEAGVDPAVVDVGALALVGLLQLGGVDALLLEPRPGGAVAALEGEQLRGIHFLSPGDATSLQREARWLSLALLEERERLPLLEVEAEEDQTELAQTLGVDKVPLTTALPEWARSTDPGCLRAVALAARAAGLVETGVNFRVDDFSYHAPSEEAFRQLRQTGIIAAATLLLGLFSYGVVVAERNTELEALRQEIRSTIAPIVPGAPAGQERIRLEGAVQGLERRRGMLAGSTSFRPPVLDVFKLITEAVPTSTALKIQELSVDGEGIRFRANTDTYESVDVIKRALATLPNVAEPDVRDVKKGIDDSIEFRVGIDFTEEGSNS